MLQQYLGFVHNNIMSLSLGLDLDNVCSFINVCVLRYDFTINNM